MAGTILVPLDGSPLAERALPYAELLAQALEARLVLVRAVVAHTFPGVDPTDAQVRAVEEAEAYLAGLAARLAERGLAVETATPYGDAVQEILLEIDLRRADLVVMATHGRSGLGRWVYGSVAAGVLARSPVPVLLVRAWQPSLAAPPIAKQPRLLVPLDGSEFAEEALPVAVRLAERLGGSLVLVQAVPVPMPVAVPGGVVVPEAFDLDSAQAEAHAYLRRVADRLAREHPGLESQVEVRVGLAADAIVAASRDHHAALVVMATHGRTGVGALLLGSVADAVLRQGSVPLLLVRPAAMRAPSF